MTKPPEDITIEAVIADCLFSLIGDMGGHDCQPIYGVKNFFRPAIDPFSILNREMTEENIKERLDHHEIIMDFPLVVQISRFDRWKDQQGMGEAFKIARREVDATLVLLGNVATDDPEEAKIFKSLLRVILWGRSPWFPSEIRRGQREHGEEAIENERP